ncbi:translocation/assembly module TamB domain-containing protein [Muricoccus vinaceus]|uniref:DUF490 domain-containing protein n=1 Tax=Muricoccus vinaceus TaxID=424704 RepID=A0ABV6IS08_9PROT
MAPRLVPLVTLALFLIGAAMAQDDAARSPSFLERQLETLVPGLRVEGLSGAWRAAPVAERITLSDAQGIWLTMQEVRLDLAPTALLRGVLRLEALDAALVRVERLPVAPTLSPPAGNPPPGQGGLLPALPDLPVDLSLDHLGVQRLELAEAVLGQAAVFSLTGSAGLEAGRLAADLSLRRLDREGSVALNLALAPKANRLNARVELREPEGGLVPTLLGLPQHPVTLELNLDGPADGAALSVQAQLGPEIALDVQGTVRSLADGSFGARLQGQARAAPLVPAEYAGLLFPAQLTLDADRSANGPLAISELRLKMPSGQGSVNGTFDIAREVPDLTIRLALDQAARFAPLLPQGVAWEALQAEAHVTGTLSAPEVRLEATPRAFTTGIRQADAVLGASPTLSGTASLPGPRIDMTFQGQEGQLAVVGSLAEPADLTARLVLPRLEVLGAGSEGALEATAQVAGPLSDPTVTLAARSGQLTLAGRTLRGISLDARLEAPATAPWAEAQLEATLDGQPVSLVLRGRPDARRLRLEQARLQVGPGVLTATGILDPDALLFDGSAQLDAPALAPLGRLAGIEGLEGQLRASGEFGPRDGVQGFDLALEAPRLAYAGNSGRLRATAKGTPGAFAWGQRLRHSRARSPRAAAWRWRTRAGRQSLQRCGSRLWERRSASPPLPGP